MKTQYFACKKCGSKIHTYTLNSIVGTGYSVELDCFSCNHTDHYHESEQDDQIEGLNIPTISNEKDKILYEMARLMRNTDGIHPSTKGPMVGNLLMRLRTIDGEKYDREVIGPL